MPHGCTLLGGSSGRATPHHGHARMRMPNEMRIDKTLLEHIDVPIIIAPTTLPKLINQRLIANERQSGVFSSGVNLLLKGGACFQY